ncbi:alpha/beta fold hydrolase [Pseudohalocynthiibacter aestuariivivens]|jgi:pimeloyl-ACP methyl ester carboxylesterase|uniref:Alpha/beta fold hydrolase n=1 Tax=Pseudohalocynthiibacter aestuariivivens TaxID=1591409 RepID=A0ABV5JGX5_9RHOB|nr:MULTISPECIES: alpha/beta hydrolase [Pseudohalocynthiibacter]MBS9718206.1 alpha/beta fold hydrolase [Pseudohalocynthiibacter aestuariivivens]MCK0103854.1 alpha/beta fold hydrolase [Pseudohalocynthiibacter sp. F2068]
MKRIFSLTTAAFFALPVGALAEEGSFLSDGVALHYTDEGTSPAVVMLHAFAGTSALWNSNGLIPLDGFRTLAFDARGHGQSDKSADPSAYGEHLVGDVIRMMVARGIEEVHIVGYSMGAETALKLATDHPDRILSLVVAGSGWSGEKEAQVYSFVSDALGSSDAFGDFMAAMPADKMTEDEQMAAFAMLISHGTTPDQAAALLSGASATMNEVIHLTAKELAAITVPVLGIAGEADEERANV